MEGERGGGWMEWVEVYLDDVVRGAHSNTVAIRMEGHSVDKPEVRERGCGWSEWQMIEAAIPLSSTTDSSVGTKQPI